MGEILHTSRIRIVRVKGPTRKAIIEGFGEPIYTIPEDLYWVDVEGDIWKE